MIPPERLREYMYVVNDYLAQVELQQLAEDRLALSQGFRGGFAHFDELLPSGCDLSLNRFTRHSFPYSIIHGQLQGSEVRQV
jgi:hypothetical protein